MKRKEAYMDDLRPIVYLVGIGMGGEDQLTGRAMDCLEAAQVVMGADRMLDSVSAYTDKKRVFSAYKPSEMVQWLGSFRWDEAALVLSGDTGFYSGAEAAAKAFLREGWDVNLFRVYPACPISAPGWERAGRMSIRSAAMEGIVMWWPISAASRAVLFCWAEPAACRICAVSWSAAE